MAPAAGSPVLSESAEMTQDLQFSWNRLMGWRAECHRRFGAVQDLPLYSPQEQIVTLLKRGMRVLDVGAGAHKPFQTAVTRITDAYFTLDSDPAGAFDYSSFEDVPKDVTFDLVIANQVLEHLHVDEAFRLVAAAFQRLVPHGGIVATVPNASHPVRQRDCTHITPWPANDLYSLLRSAGFHITAMARYNKFPLTRNPLRRWVVQTVCREFRVDWCDSIMAVGVKKV